MQHSLLLFQQAQAYGMSSGRQTCDLGCAIGAAVKEQPSTRRTCRRLCLVASHVTQRLRKVPQSGAYRGHGSWARLLGPSERRLHGLEYMAATAMFHHSRTPRCPAFHILPTPAPPVNDAQSTTTL